MRIPSPERRLDAYPHEMSGGMRQRAMIALALACQPQILLADEPTTALDATVQIQILLLLRELQRELGLSMIFVTHDIGVAVEVADRIAVMYAGRIVEIGPVRDVIRTPRHPYTIGLLSTRAHGGRLSGKRLPAIAGSPPDLANLPPGCAFAPRCCSLAVDPCPARALPEPLCALGVGAHLRALPAHRRYAAGRRASRQPSLLRSSEQRAEFRSHAHPRHQPQHHRRHDGDHRTRGARRRRCRHRDRRRHLDRPVRSPSRATTTRPLCSPGLLMEIRKGEALGADGHVIACFDDTGLDAARQIAAAPWSASARRPATRRR